MNRPMFNPSINVLRSNMDSKASFHDAFAHFLVRFQPAESVRRSELQKLFARAGIAHSVIRSSSVGETSIFEVGRTDGSTETARDPVLTVVLVESGHETGRDNKLLVSRFENSLKAEDVPWSPEVIVACLGQKEAVVSNYSACLDAHFSGANIRFIDVLPNGKLPEAFWWWRYHGKRVAMWSSSGGAVPLALQKVLSMVNAAGIKEAGEPPLVCSERNVFEAIELFQDVGLLVFNFQDDWCFEEKLKLTERRRKENEDERSRFLVFLSQLLKRLPVGPEDIRMIVSRTHVNRKLHPDIEFELGEMPRFLPSAVFTPLSVQLSQIAAEKRYALSVLAPAINKEISKSETVSETTLKALNGRMRVLEHRIALQEARSGGDIATRLDSLFEAAQGELEQIIDHTIESMKQRLRVGAYNGVDNTKDGVGSREGPRWVDRFPLSRHFRAEWSKGPGSEAGGQNWLVSERSPLGKVARVFDRKCTVEPNDWIKEQITKAVSKDCSAGLARLSLTTDLFFETVIRGESRAMLRELETSVPQSEAARFDKLDPLPSGSHGATGLAGRRAAKAIAAKSIKDSVLIWPKLEKLPTRLNVRRNLKSLGLLTRQAGKLISILILVAAFSKVDLTPTAVEDALMRANAALSGVIPRSDADKPTDCSTQFFCFEATKGYYWTIKGEQGDSSKEIGLVLLFVLISVLILTIWLSVNAHMAQLAEKLDKLRDDTHKCIENAAIQQLSIARNIALEVIEDDMATLRSDLAAAIQARDGKVLTSLRFDRCALEARIARHEPQVKQHQKTLVTAQKDQDGRRKKMVMDLKKIFSLDGLQS